jgi:ribokinase
VSERGQDGYRVPAQKVTPVDTTAAGDTFNGGLVVGLSEGMSLQAAVSLGAQAAAISVTRPGAQTSVPWRADLPDA